MFLLYKFKFESFGKSIRGARSNTQKKYPTPAQIYQPRASAAQIYQPQAPPPPPPPPPPPQAPQTQTVKIPSYNIQILKPHKCGSPGISKDCYIGKDLVPDSYINGGNYSNPNFFKDGLQWVVGSHDCLSRYDICFPTCAPGKAPSKIGDTYRCR